jgi:excinuclease UvrABC nuclease subunit
MREASLQDIEAVPGIPAAVAKAVHDTLHGDAPGEREAS